LKLKIEWLVIYSILIQLLDKTSITKTHDFFSKFILSNYSPVFDEKKQKNKIIKKVYFVTPNCFGKKYSL
jgi:hypothetical protein